MEAYIIFNGVSSAELGYIVEQLPDEPRPMRNAQEMPRIQGRSGREYYDEGTYDVYSTRIVINPNGHALSELYAWLTGEGWLTSSEDPAHMRYVHFFQEAKDSRFRIGSENYDSVTFTLTVQPYAYLVQAPDLTYSAPAVFNGLGSMPAEPLIAVTGSGDINLMLNDSSVLIDGLSGTMYIDCDSKTAYVIRNNTMDIYMMPVTIVDDWPKLLPGANELNWSGSVSRVVITPRWRDL